MINIKKFYYLLVFVSTFARGNTYSFAILGDAGKRDTFTERAKNSISEFKVKNMILPGDNLYDEFTEYSQVWSTWSNFNFPLVAIGNHTKSYQEEVAYFKMPGEYYTYEVSSNLLFLVLNSDNETNVNEQARFLEYNLAKSNHKLVFVVYHHPPITISPLHEWEEKRDFHLKTMPIILRYESKIDGILVGHDHLSTLFTIGSIPVILASSAMEVREKFYLLDTKKNGVKVKTHYMFDKTHEWGLLKVSPDTEEFSVSFIRTSTNEVSCTFAFQNRKMFKAKNCKEFSN